MSTPIKSPINSSNATGSPAVSPALSDLMARLNSQGQGTDAQSQQLAFSRWMEKHAVVADNKPPQASKPQVASAQASEPGAASRLAEQALARSRQQAMAGAKAGEPLTQDASSHQADKASRPKADQQAAKPVRKEAAAKDKAPKADKGDRANQADKPDDHKDDVPFSTAMGEGSAMVRELTPPSSIQPGDAAGMMAWLASLTNGDAGAGKGAAALSDAALQDAAQGSGAQAGQAEGDLLDKTAANSAQGGLVLDSPLWQSAGASGSAALQVDALLGAAGKSGELKAEGDPLAGLIGGGALKGASAFGQILQGATQEVRHESATLNAPFGSTDFAQALAEKVSMWVGSARTDGAMTAELHLNPAEMGPINVKISLDGQSAHVDFAAAAVETRKAIEASLPMLSSALNDVGLSLTGGDVSSQTSQQSFGQAPGQPEGARGRLFGDGDADAATEPAPMRAVAAPRPGRLGGLDLYA